MLTGADGLAQGFGVAALDAGRFEVAGDAESVEGAGVQGAFLDRFKSSSTRPVPEVEDVLTALRVLLTEPRPKKHRPGGVQRHERRGYSKDK